MSREIIDQGTVVVTTTPTPLFAFTKVGQFPIVLLALENLDADDNINGRLQVSEFGAVPNNKRTRVAVVEPESEGTIPIGPGNENQHCRADVWTDSGTAELRWRLIGMTAFTGRSS